MPELAVAAMLFAVALPVEIRGADAILFATRIKHPPLFYDELRSYLENLIQNPHTFLSWTWHMHRAPGPTQAQPERLQGPVLLWQLRRALLVPDRKRAGRAVRCERPGLLVVLQRMHDRLPVVRRSDAGLPGSADGGTQSRETAANATGLVGLPAPLFHSIMTSITTRPGVTRGPIYDNVLLKVIGADTWHPPLGCF